MESKGKKVNSKPKPKWAEKDESETGKCTNKIEKSQFIGWENFEAQKAESSQCDYITLNMIEFFCISFF